MLKVRDTSSSLFASKVTTQKFLKNRTKYYKAMAGLWFYTERKILARGEKRCLIFTVREIPGGKAVLGGLPCQCGTSVSSLLRDRASFQHCLIIMRTIINLHGQEQPPKCCCWETVPNASGVGPSGRSLGHWLMTSGGAVEVLSALKLLFWETMSPSCSHDRCCENFL